MAYVSSVYLSYYLVIMCSTYTVILKSVTLQPIATATLIVLGRVRVQLPGRLQGVQPDVPLGVHLRVLELGVGAVEPVPEAEPAVAGVEAEVVEVVELGRVHDGKVEAGVVVLNLEVQEPHPGEK